MAVTPVGNPYVESSDRVSDYPGASEALAERIDIVGVNPFADSAARATAIPSPVEGQMASLNDDDKVYRYSGSAWVAVGLPPGLNPVTPSSIANTGGSASTTGNTTTFTTVTALSLNGIFSATYLNYLALIVVTPSASGHYLRSRLRVSGVDATGANYDMQQVEFYSTTTLPQIQIDQTSWRTCYLGTNGDTCINIEFYRPNTSVNTLFKTNSAQPTEILLGGGDHDLATAYDGLTIYPDTGTITGTITVYGYAR